MGAAPMKRLAIAVLLPLSLHAQQPIDTALARSYFAELRQLGATDGEKLWGRRVAGPMMFVDPSSHAIVANESDAKGILREQHGLWFGSLPKESNPANTAIDFGGRKFSMVMWPLPDSRYSRRRLLMHESFHRIQGDLGIPGYNPSNAHLATADGRIWTRLEWRALTEALLHDGAARKHALADALTFRARRRLASPQAAEDERQLELNEGLAEYTGLVLSGIPRSALYDRAAVLLAQNESQESFVRSFAYTSGPAYGILLDAKGPAWRRTIDARSDISALAQRLYGITSIDPKNAESLIDRYTGARMVADEKSKEAKRLASEARLRGIFRDSSVLRLPLTEKLSFSFDPNSAMPLQGMGIIYQAARISDAWGVLEIDSGNVLMERRADGTITGIIAALPTVTGNAIKGPGWSLTLADGWTTTQGGRPGEITLTRR
jgi:hypothetical protein